MLQHQKMKPACQQRGVGRETPLEGRVFAREMPRVSTGVAGEEKRGVRSVFLPDRVHSANSFTSRIGT